MKSFSAEKKQKKTAASWLKAQSKVSKRYIQATIAISVLSGILLIFQMYALAHIAYASYIKQLDRESLLAYFILFFGLILVRSVLAWLRENVSFKASSVIRADVRHRLLDKVSQLGPVGVSHLRTGAVVSSVIEQTEALHNYFVKYLPQMSIAVFLPLAILVFIFPISVTSAILLLVCAPLIPLFMALVGMGAESLHQKNFQAISKMSQFFLDTLQGLASLKLLGKSKSHASQVFEASDEYRKKTMSVLRIAFLSSAVLEVFAAASIALLAIYLGMGFINTGTGNDMWWGLDDITLQGALFILLLAPEFFLPLRELGTYYHARAEAIGAALEIQKVLNMPVSSSTVDSEEMLNIDKQQAIALSFHHVNYQYGNTKQFALTDISCNIEPNTKVAIVGYSGAGKSTMMNLLLKFIHPSSGHIKMNGIGLGEITEESWYENVSWLGQDPMLFSGTIRQNLLLADDSADDETLWAVLKKVMLADVIAELPDQLDTSLGERSAGLSGGQAQRLALARALLKNSPLLLLDEPMASLDQHNERLIAEVLQQNWHNKTVILSTHRASMLQQMDNIIVLEQGQITQFGDYQTLMADQTGYFYRSAQLMGLDK